MKRLVGISVLCTGLLWSNTAAAQTPQPAQQPSAQVEATRPMRPATTTASGTTGLWFVPTAEVLDHKKWSLSFYRTNIDDGQGFTDISMFPATFAVGIRDRAEIFGSWSLVTRLDRDTRPLFFNPPTGTNAAEEGTGGGLVVDHPLQRSEWSGNQFGDFWVGGKVNFLTPTLPAGIAARAMIKLPTGDDKAASTGATDFQFDGIFSGRNRHVEATGYAGFIFRGSPDGYELTDGFRWGLGVAFPQRYTYGLTGTAELFGESYFDDVITAPLGQLGDDGSIVPTESRVKGPTVEHEPVHGKPRRRGIPE
jgi:hypothetical protein